MTADDRLILRTGDPLAAGQPALALDTVGGGRLRFGKTNATGGVNEVFAVSADGNVTIAGRLDPGLVVGTVLDVLGPGHRRNAVAATAWSGSGRGRRRQGGGAHDSDAALPGHNGKRVSGRALRCHTGPAGTLPAAPDTGGRVQRTPAPSAVCDVVMTAIVEAPVDPAGGTP